MVILERVNISHCQNENKGENFLRRILSVRDVDRAILWTKETHKKKGFFIERNYYHETSFKKKKIK
jgi:hypothetical protein